jgi:hypothetical protein
MTHVNDKLPPEVLHDPLLGCLSPALAAPGQAVRSAPVRAVVPRCRAQLSVLKLPAPVSCRDPGCSAVHESFQQILQWQHRDRRPRHCTNARALIRRQAQVLAHPVAGSPFSAEPADGGVVIVGTGIDGLKARGCAADTVRKSVAVERNCRISMPGSHDHAAIFPLRDDVEILGKPAGTACPISASINSSPGPGLRSSGASGGSPSTLENPEMIVRTRSKRSRVLAIRQPSRTVGRHHHPHSEAGPRGHAH